MSVRIYTCHLQGLDCRIVEVEVHISNGLPAFHIVGLGDTAVHESKERVRSALMNSGYRLDNKRKTINLAPADIRKQGPAFDLPIAVGLLVESGQISMDALNEAVFIGELSLNGELKSIAGALVITDFVKRSGFKRIFIPEINLKESRLISGVEIFGLSSLKDLEEPILNRSFENIENEAACGKGLEEDFEKYDFALVKGQSYAKRALEIAAAGGHNILMEGPPGCGKTLLARSVQSILPPLSFAEKIEISRIYSVASLLSKDKVLIEKRPFREIHHTASAISIIGGGTNPKPGEISLAHKGIIFMDEIAEFPNKVLEVLRQPLEKKEIRISRAKGSCVFPADFQLIAAMNPCPCGFSQHPKKQCNCTETNIQKYRARLSGPMRDRIDITIKMQPVDILNVKSLSESSNGVFKRVEIAHKIQMNRYSKELYTKNSCLDLHGLNEYVELSKNAKNILIQAMGKLDISMRSHDRLIKLARTIADLDQSSQVKSHHMSEAIAFRD